MMIPVFTTVDCYLPGYKFGGPVRAIANMVEALGDVYKFSVFTADRDLGDAIPYPGIRVDAWQAVGRATVYYASPRNRKIALIRELRAARDGVIHLNGFFSSITVEALSLRRAALLRFSPVVVSPRGEFSVGALAMKAARKNAYLALARTLRLTREVIWQASSDGEAQDIQRVFPSSPDIVVTSEFSAPAPLCPSIRTNRKMPGQAHIVFVSRVSPMKNLLGALKALAKVRGEVVFDIFGPREESAYWDACADAIRELPDHIVVQYRGVLRPEQVVPTFGQYHLFFFPTFGENYGHVIVEALQAGCPALISTNTPWPVAARQAGWEVDAHRIESSVNALQTFIDMDTPAFEQMSRAAYDLGIELSNSETAQIAHQQLYALAASRSFSRASSI